MGAEKSLLFCKRSHCVTEVDPGYTVYFAFLSSPLFDSVAGTCTLMSIAESECSVASGPCPWRRPGVI